MDLFTKGCFLLCKWNSSSPPVLSSISPELLDMHSTHQMPSPKEYTKTLGVEWNSHSDHFRLTIASLPSMDNVMKHALTSDIAKTFDVLEWFSPSTIKAKILLQRLWEQRIEWDELLPTSIHQEWLQWRSELPLLSERHIPRCYYPTDVDIDLVQLHGFCAASEDAYAGVIYFQAQD